MSEIGTGPQLIYQNDKFRIEGYFEGRPLTVWEMRNPMISNLLAEHLCDFNFNQKASTKVNEIMPMDENNLFIHQVIKQWAPNLKSKIHRMKEMLKESGSREHMKNLRIAQLVEKTFLFDGYQDYFQNLIPKMHQPARFDKEYLNEFPNVLTHNDCHQNNIMMSMKNNLDLILIDFEYAGWNPMAMDVACYINETMNDNSYPGDNGIKWYLTNLMTVQEQGEFIKTYLKHYFFNYMSS